ncbi:MAG: transposase [Nitrospirae bacterium]|nr:MAG: transposase [Nitrospirota bacterium]
MGNPRRVGLPFCAISKNGVYAPPRLVIGDGHLGIWAGLRNGSPEVEEQRCWNHKTLNVLEKIPKGQQATARALVCQIPYAETVREAERRREQFGHWCRHRGYDQAADCLTKDWDRMLTFYRFPKAHWQHLRTTNPVESPFAAARLRTDAANRFKKVANATAVIWKMLMVAEQAFRCVKHPELMPAVFRGMTCENGVAIKPEVAA